VGPSGVLGRDTQWVIHCAIVLNVLLFVRVAVLSSPFYSYQGPSGADRVYYYAYTRSIVIDHDLDFTNEFAARPPSSGAIFRNGRQLNKYPIGTPILSLPAFAVVHGVTSTLRWAGVGLSTDGYSLPYTMAFALSQMVFALLGVWLLYLTLLRYFTDRIAAIAVVTAWFGTNSLHYTAVDLMMSHAAALFSTAWCGYESVTLSESRRDGEMVPAGRRARRGGRHGAGHERCLGATPGRACCARERRPAPIGGNRDP
jgi:hypothetical protein